MSDCVERRFSMESGAVDTPLGVYLVKGDQMYVNLDPNMPFNLTSPDSCLLGEVDDAIEQATDWSKIHAEPLPPMRYGDS